MPGEGYGDPCGQVTIPWGHGSTGPETRAEEEQEEEQQQQDEEKQQEAQQEEEEQLEEEEQQQQQEEQQQQQQNGSSRRRRRKRGSRTRFAPFFCERVAPRSSGAPRSSHTLSYSEPTENVACTVSDG